jgi:hypothetical protein
MNIKMNETLLFFKHNSTSKSFIDSSPFLEFWRKHIKNASNIKLMTKKVNILLEIKMIQQSEQLAELKKE